MAGVGPVRNRKKQLRWRRIVRGQAGSGLSVRTYCSRQGVKESAYYWWRAQLARRDAESPPSPAAFVPVEVVAEEPTRGAGEGGGQIEILWPGGWKVRVSGRVDHQTLSDVLASLGAQPC
jgi:transposase